jgi:sortase A
MSLSFPKELQRPILKWTQRALFACAVLLLGYCGLALVDAWVFQRRESSDLDRLVRDRRIVQHGAADPRLAASPKEPPAVATDGPIGRIEIPRLRLSVIVAEGVDKSTLRHAVGHIPGTALPGQPGNVALAGHRDTFFRRLKDLKIKDEIRFSTPEGDFKYEVVSLKVVEPDDVAVVASTGEDVLTMVTCYPFYYAGPAPKRWVVRARQVSSHSGEILFHRTLQ